MNTNTSSMFIFDSQNAICSTECYKKFTHPHDMAAKCTSNACLRSSVCIYKVFCLCVSKILCPLARQCRLTSHILVLILKINSHQTANKAMKRQARNNPFRFHMLAWMYLNPQHYNVCWRSEVVTGLIINYWKRSCRENACTHLVLPLTICVLFFFWNGSKLFGMSC